MPQSALVLGHRLAHRLRDQIRAGARLLPGRREGFGHFGTAGREPRLFEHSKNQIGAGKVIFSL
jgi:hypothetical protein